MAQDQTTRIKELRRAFQDADRKRAELNGRRDQLMERLEKEFNVKTLTDAEALAEKLASDLKAKNSELDTTIKKLEAMKA